MSRFGLHDHEANQPPMYCTLMKEICHGGWTKSMGDVKTNDGAKIRPRCHKWVGVFVNDPISGKVKEVFDCNEKYHTDVMQQVAEEVYHGAAATEQVRNKMASSERASQLIISFFVQIAHKMGLELKLPNEKPEDAKKLANQGGSNGNNGNGQ